MDKFVNIVWPGKFTHSFEHQGNTYPYNPSSLHQSSDFNVLAQLARIRNQNHLPVRSKKAYIYHNAEAAGITCLDVEKGKHLK